MRTMAASTEAFSNTAVPQHISNDHDRFPVIEIFGPTIQGEGADAGRPAHFVRFGGCDFRCSWCDSMYAVEPAQVRTAERLDVDDVLSTLGALPTGPNLVVLTGGNPALHELGSLVDALHVAGYEVAVETQGSVWRDWLGLVDFVVVSPKPPSSGMTRNTEDVNEFLARAAAASKPNVTLKVVIFDANDLEWAVAQFEGMPRLRTTLSAGTDVGFPEAETLARLRERYAWLCESVARRVELRTARVLPQLHVVAWGIARGV
jgi:7-carboxy-7-deazaguanine synthase